MGKSDFLPSNIEGRAKMKELLGEEGVETLAEIWKRSIYKGNKYFRRESIRKCFDGTSPYGFVADDFRTFTDYMAIGLKNEYYSIAKNLTFLPLRAPLFNAGAWFDEVNNENFIFFWSSMYHAISLSADENALLAFSTRSVENTEIYRLYRNSFHNLLVQILFFGMPYLSSRLGTGPFIQPKEIYEVAQILKLYSCNFVIGHELGHIVLGHTKNKIKKSEQSYLEHQSREIAADVWSIKTAKMQIPKYFMLSVQVFFDVLYFTEYIDLCYMKNSFMTHPSSMKRITVCLDEILKRKDMSQSDRNFIQGYLDSMRRRHELHLNIVNTPEYVAYPNFITELLLEIRKLSIESDQIKSVDEWINTIELLPTFAYYEKLKSYYDFEIFRFLKREKGLLQLINGDETYNEYIIIENGKGMTLLLYDLINRKWQKVNIGDEDYSRIDKTGILDVEFQGDSIPIDTISEAIKGTGFVAHYDVEREYEILKKHKKFGIS